MRNFTDLFVLSLVFYAGGSLASVLAVSDNIIITVSSHPQLFVDDYGVRRMEGVRRELQKPHLSPEPLIKQEYPWEKRCLIANPVIYDERINKFRCWYAASEHPDGKPEYFTCYAESNDGIHWERPMIGEGTFKSWETTYEKHNIVGGVVFILPPGGPATEKYRAVNGATSENGIHWKTDEEAAESWKQAVLKNDTLTSVVWFNGQYLAYVRNQEYDHRPKGGLQRAVALTASSDGRHWMPKKTIWMTDVPDGYPWAQPHGLAVLNCGDILIGLLPMMHIDPFYGNDKLADWDIQLLSSRDGIHWERVCDREVFIPQGQVEPPVWDVRRNPAGSPFRKGDTIYMYYTGTNCRHAEKPLLESTHGTGLATLPADRFVAIRPESDKKAGILETGFFQFSGKELLVNAEAALGELQVELINKAEQVIPAFDRDHCTLVRHDDLRYRVFWKTRKKEAPLADAVDEHQPIALRFILKKNAKLFAWQIVE
jgi:hypothetical protein